MDIGLELLEVLQFSLPPGAAGLADLDALLGVPGVPGGVMPLPLALLAPITFTSSFTETPCSSGGMSLFTGIEYFLCWSIGDDFLLDDGGLADLEGLFSSSPLNHFWKKDFLSTDPALPRGNVGELGGFDAAAPPTAPTATAPCRGGVVGLTGLGRLFILCSGMAGLDSILLGDIVVDMELETDMDTSDGENAVFIGWLGSAGTPGAQTLWGLSDSLNGDI